MIIAGGNVYTAEFRFSRRDIRIRGGRIEAVAEGPLAPERGEETVDAAGLYVLPGLVDIHFHGCAGFDLCDATQRAISAMARFERSAGVTAICPASMTLPAERIRVVCRRAAAHRPAKGEADLVGINLEGPFVSPERAGAQNPAHVIRPDASLLEQWLSEGGGLVRLVTVAPEVPGVRTLIRRWKRRVRFSLGHTNADYETAAAAFRAGARQLTHTFNAMPQLSHRRPGPVGAALDDPRVAAELICDGHHVHPAMVRAAFRLFGAERIILISDSTRACGMPDGEYELGGLPIFKAGGAARLADGTLAGSVTNLYNCMKMAMRMGIPAEDAIRAATRNPAAAIGILPEYGTVEPGKKAKLVLADRDFQIQRVIA